MVMTNELLQLSKHKLAETDHKYTYKLCTKCYFV